MSNTTWVLGNGVERNRAHPDTFYIPSDTDKARLTAGDVVKLMFLDEDGGGGERMWVTIVAVGPDEGYRIGRTQFAGVLANAPICFDGLEYGDAIIFDRDNIINID